MTRVPFAALLAAFVLPASAGDFVPGGNAGALARNFALPVLGEPHMAAPGRAETQLTLDFTNEYVDEGTCSDECITLDGETTRLRLAHRRALGRDWDFSLDLPVLIQGGGFLDGWIQDWHGWFGLPNGGRELVADNQYRYRYVRGNVTLLDVTDYGTCVGDLSLGLGRAVGRSAVLRGMVKVPTHAKRDLCGGTAGGALWFDAALPLPPRWSGYLALGYSLNQRGDELGPMQQRQVPFGGAGILVPVMDRVRLSMQLQVNGRLYEGSALSPLAKAGMPLTLGLQFQTGPRSTLDLGFQEDPNVNGSPDFAAYLAVTAH